MLYFLNNDSITVIFEDNDTAVWKREDPNFSGILTLAEKGLYEPIKTLHNYAKQIMSGNAVKVTDEGVDIGEGEAKVTIKYSEEDPFMALIKTLKEKGVIDSDIEKAKPFLKNCLENKYIDSVHELYEYCKAKDFEITEDGCFLAYKRVNKNYGSIHDGGKTKHVVGQYTEVTNFDTNRRNECSQGLHFCSRSYLSSYSGDKVIIVKINPKDVVAIPMDYNFAKGRCKRYMMVGEMAPDGTLQTTNLEEATGEKIIKTKAKARLDRKVSKKKADTSKSTGRIQETVQNMKIYKDDVAKVAKVMNISPETVKRNMRKARAKG